ncbi:MAG: putative signal transducing protein [Verrucomicrobiales bacterium]|jgi:hypothetical protein
MRKVYQNHATERVGYYQSILESEGIPTFLKNEATLQVEGTAFPSYVYPELWVTDDEDYVRAIAILEPFESESNRETAPISS